MKKWIKNIFLKIILWILPEYIINYITNPYRLKISELNVSYSQEGEDLILNRFFRDRKYGFYVDIGAHHPIRLSNTYKFYLNGWRGINIDAMPNCMSEFQRIRPNDINIEVPISNRKQSLEYFIFNETALNTFSKIQAIKKDGLFDYKIVKSIVLEAVPLCEVLDRYLPENTIIDFFTIDVEGLDLHVLKSNNWSKYKPEFILVETLDINVSSICNDEIYKYLHEIGYQIVAKTYNTCFYKIS